MNRRDYIISQIVGAIKELFNKDLDIDFEKFVYKVCYEYKSSRRTSMEYIMTALSQFDYRIINIDGTKYISKGL